MRRHCYHCGRELSPLEAYYWVRRARAPKGTPRRWQRIGVACETCIDVHDKPVQYEETP